VAERGKIQFGPVIGLFFAAPLVAEFLLGNLPVKLLPALIVLAPMYGGGAVLIREIVRRSGRGWPSILLLGMAYGVFEEAFVTQSLFNPNYLKLNLGLLTPAFIPELGISAWWTLWMLMVHGIWSISTPIALIESCLPDRARTPWLGRVGLCIVAIVFLAGSAAAALLGYKNDRFLAGTAQFICAALVIAVLVMLAFLIPVKRGLGGGGTTPQAWGLGTVALVLASAAMFVPKEWGWGAVAALLALDGGMVVAVRVWTRKSAPSLGYQLALSAGAALAYGLHAFVQRPSVGGVDASTRVGNVIFLAAAVGLIGFGARRVHASEAAVRAAVR
jgi:hypothetical protein